jgi:hypothetical protein
MPATEDGHIPLFAFVRFHPWLKRSTISAMRNAAWLALLLSLPAFSQATPDNAASGSLEKRLQSLKLLNGTPLKMPTSVVVSARAFPSKVCAIPLINVLRPGFQSKMPIMGVPVSPEEAAHEPKLSVPAPACDPALFQNR